MKMKCVLLFIFSFCTLCMAGCGNSTEAELKKIVQRNLNAMQEEDLETALMDIDDGPAKETNREALKAIFDQYDISYKLVSFKVLSVSDDTAEVEVVQETKKIRGPAFRNNVGTVVHTFKKRPSGWKFVSSEIKSAKFLD